MPWIHEGDAGGPNLKNGLPNVIKLMSINPRAMFAVLNMAAALSFGASSLLLLSPGCRRKPSPRRCPRPISAAIELWPTERRSVCIPMTRSWPAM